ncbi:hypothetical protein GCM10028805_37770 [Spirosoma harenae]
MALSEALKEKLLLHINGQETRTQKREFWKLLQENTEFAQAYQALRLAHDAHDPGGYEALLVKRFEEAEAQVMVTPVVEPPIKPVPSWWEKIGSQLNIWLDAAVEKLQMVLQPPAARLAFALTTGLVIFGGGSYMYQETQYPDRAKGNFGNALNTQGALTAPNENKEICSAELKDKFYTYESKTTSATIDERIGQLNQLTSIPETCRAYYLGRAYLWKDDYPAAIESFKKVRSSPNANALTKDMATYDLALCYLVTGEEQKCIDLLNSQSSWSDPYFAGIAADLQKEATSRKGWW